MADKKDHQGHDEEGDWELNPDLVERFVRTEERRAQREFLIAIVFFFFLLNAMTRETREGTGSDS